MVADGRLYDRAGLDARLARYSAHYQSAAYSRFLLPILRGALDALTSSPRRDASAPTGHGPIGDGESVYGDSSSAS